MSRTLDQQNSNYSPTRKSHRFTSHDQGSSPSKRNTSPIRFSSNVMEYLKSIRMQLNTLKLDTKDQLFSLQSQQAMNMKKIHKNENILLQLKKLRDPQLQGSSVTKSEQQIITEKVTKQVTQEFMKKFKQLQKSIELQNKSSEIGTSLKNSERIDKFETALGQLSITIYDKLQGNLMLQRNFLDKYIKDQQKKLSALEEGFLKIIEKKEKYIKGLHLDHQEVREMTETNSRELKKLLAILLSRDREKNKVKQHYHAKRIEDKLTYFESSIKKVQQQIVQGQSKKSKKLEKEIKNIQRNLDQTMYLLGSKRSSLQHPQNQSSTSQSQTGSSSFKDALQKVQLGNLQKELQNTIHQSVQKYGSKIDKLEDMIQAKLEKSIRRRNDQPQGFKENIVINDWEIKEEEYDENDDGIKYIDSQQQIDVTSSQDESEGNQSQQMKLDDDLSSEQNQYYNQQQDRTPQSRHSSNSSQKVFNQTGNKFFSSNKNRNRQQKPPQYQQQQQQQEQQQDYNNTDSVNDIMIDNNNMKIEQSFEIDDDQLPQKPQHSQQSSSQFEQQQQNVNRKKKKPLPKKKGFLNQKGRLHQNFRMNDFRTDNDMTDSQQFNQSQTSVNSNSALNNRNQLSNKKSEAFKRAELLRKQEKMNLHKKKLPSYSGLKPPQAPAYQQQIIHNQERSYAYSPGLNEQLQQLSQGTYQAGSEQSEEEIIYQLDEQGFLMDEAGNYLLDEFGQQIKLQDEQISQLRERGIVTEEESGADN